MKKILFFVALSLLCIVSYAQSPFTQSNAQHTDNAKAILSSKQSLVEVNMEKFLIQKLAVDTTSVTREFKIQERLKKVLDSLSEDQISIKNKIKRPGIASADRIRLQNELNLTNKALQKAKDDSIRAVAEQSRVIDSLKFVNLKLRNEKTKLQLQITGHDIKILVDTLSSFSLIIKEMQSEWEQQKWREEGKNLSKNEDSLLFIAFSKITLSLNESLKRRRELQPLVDTLEVRYLALTKQEQRISSLLDEGFVGALLERLATLSENMSKSIDAFNADVLKLNTSLTETSVFISSKQKEYNENEKVIASLYAAHKKEEKQEPGDIKTIANFIQPMTDDGRLVPQISVLAFKQDNTPDKVLAYSLKLFVAAAETKSIQNSEIRFFMPEASTYGFMTDFSFGFLPMAGKDKDKRLGLNLGAYYLGKNMVRPDSTSFSLGLLQFKTGVQYVLIRHVLSVYANLNPFFVANGVSNLSNLKSGYSNKLNSFTDFGIECYLDLTKKQENFFLNFDIGFINRAGDVKNIVTTNDALLPRIKLGLVKSFNF